MYTTVNFKTKKALKEAVANGEVITVFQPSSDIFGGNAQTEGIVVLEGPHYPAPHTWCVDAIIKNGIIVKVK